MMKIRTCPNCGYKYSFSTYFTKLLFKFIDSSLECTKCSAELKFSVGRRTVVAIVGMLPIALNTIILDVLQGMGLSNAISWTFFVLMFAVWIVLIYSLDTFTLIKKGAK